MSIYVPEDIRARFKATCALEKLSMNQVVTDFIQKWLEEKEKPYISDSRTKDSGGKANQGKGG